MPTRHTVAGLLRLVETYGRHYQHGATERRERRAQVKAYAEQLIDPKRAFAGELAQISRQLSRMEKLIMASKQEFEDGFAAVNTATNSIAVLIQKLIDQRAAGGMTAADEDAQLETLKTLVTTLNAMGVDPADPVPVPVPPAP